MPRCARSHIRTPNRRPCAVAAAAAVGTREVFFFFSNRLGCAGSILVSLVGTLLVLVLLGIVNLD